VSIDIRVILVAAVLLVGLASAASAQPLAPRDVPAPLQPWIPWVLKGSEPQRCPVLPDDDDTPLCAWPGALRLELGPAGGRFTQSWEVLAETVVPLPGDGDRWPFDVRTGGQGLAVLGAGESEAPPRVRLGPGRHQLSGSFVWQRLPETLPVPPETGIVSLRLGARELPVPARDQGGALFLGAGPAASGTAEPVEADRLEIDVHRRLVDEVPALLSTRITLKVAGKSREVLLGKPLPGGFVPQALDSALPVRLQDDGRLRVQVRPGAWTVTLEARHETPVASLGRPAPDGPWKQGPEVWVFEARPSLRVVAVENVPAVDPGQTTLPAEWRGLPAYLVNPGATVRLQQRRRGDADPAGDELHLARRMWLDFDGGGYTASDQINGRLSRSWRLDMGRQGALGRVAVGGADQLITRVAPDGLSGIEVRPARVRVTADSRFPDRRFSVPAVGWAHDFQSVNTTLAMPPGWRLLHASGADKVETTWIKRWTLLDLFLVLVVVIATARLFGRWPAAAALVTLVIIAQEPGAPAWIWLVVLVGEALVRALPAGQLRRAAKLYRLVAAVALVIVALPFCVRQARMALHPALDLQEGGYFDLGREMGTAQLAAPAAPPPMEAESTEERKQELADQVKNTGILKIPGAAERKADLEGVLGGIEGGVSGTVGSAFGVGGLRSRAGGAQSAAPAQAVQSVDPNARIQTGPGIPRWQWRQARLTWNGPVERGARLHLWFSPPWLTGLLGLSGAALVAALALLLLRNALSMFGRWLPLVAGLALLAPLLSSAPAQAQPGGPFPPKELLDELRTRLLEKPPCHPDCASFGRLALEAAPDRLRLRLEVHAAAASVVDLPGLAQHFAPSLVQVNGAAASAVRRDGSGRLWLFVPAGAHQVLLEGPLPDRPTVQIAFGRLRPHAVTATLRGFTLAGVAEDGAVGDSLELTRSGARPVAPAPGSEAGAVGQSLPPFVQVQRTLDLGLEWRVHTRVVRLTPPGTAVVLQVPLLVNESVLTPDTKIAVGKVQVNMGPDASEVVWSSTLAERSPITLQAAPATPGTPLAFSEQWQLDLSPVWHAELTGIPPVHQPPRASPRSRQWRPWPGETVTIAVSRPAGVPASTFTIDASQMQLRPGARTTEATLTLSVRSSRGGEHSIRLPAGARLESLKIDGRDQPPTTDGQNVTLPLQPGAQEITLGLRTPDQLGLVYRTPDVVLGAPSVNADLQVNLSADRWLLLVGGPRLGPAVLMWSVLLVLVFVGLFLGRSRLTPLSGRQWVLLGLGFAPLSIWAAAVMVGFLFALGWRRDHFRATRPWLHNLVQLLLAFWTAVALGVLFNAVHEGLLSRPDMDIVGNASSAHELRWYADRAAGPLPRAWVISLPMFAYHLAMLAWALWLAASVLRWSRWAWSCFTEGGLWRPMTGPRPPASQSPPPASAPPT
jgi:hypothetical protein